MDEDVFMKSIIKAGKRLGIEPTVLAKALYMEDDWKPEEAKPPKPVEPDLSSFDSIEKYCTESNIVLGSDHHIGLIRKAMKEGILKS